MQEGISCKLLMSHLFRRLGGLVFMHVMHGAAVRVFLKKLYEQSLGLVRGFGLRAVVQMYRCARR
jgi:hypothetical protein